jgi:hypothetical protein
MPAGYQQLDGRELIRLVACAGGRRFRRIRIAPTGGSLTALANRHDRSHYGVGELATLLLAQGKRASEEFTKAELQAMPAKAVRNTF